MPNPNLIKASPFDGVRNVSGARADSYRGAYTDRQRRHEARGERRWGDWFILGVPTPVLWFDDPYAFCPYGELTPWGPVFEPIEPVIIDLWP